MIGLTSAALVAAAGSHFAVPDVKPAVSHEVMNIAAIDDSPTAVGISDSNIYFTDDLEEVKRRLELTASLGVTNIRLLVPWWHIQRIDPQGLPVDWAEDLDWAKLDAIVNEADRLGLGILGVLQWTPAWATDGPAGTGHPSDPQYLADFAAAVATRYGNKITAYEVWNEPNAAFFWNPVDPVEYTRMLKATYTALKAVNQDITVVGAVVGAGVTIGEWTMNPVDFVAAMYAAGADGYFDAISFHPYNFVTKFSEQDANALSPLFQILELREMLDAHQDPGEEQLKIWITEYGLPTSQVSAATQLEFMTDILTAWKSFSGAGPVFLYTIKDELYGWGDEPYFGIFDSEGNPKDPAELAKFIEFIRCLDGCAPPTNPANPLEALVRAIQQVVAQLVSFVPKLVAGVVAAVTTWLGGILGGLSGAPTTAAAMGAAAAGGASLLSARADDEIDGEKVASEVDPSADGIDGTVPTAEAAGGGQLVGETTVDPAVAEPILDPGVVSPVVADVIVDPVVAQPIEVDPIVVTDPIVVAPIAEQPIVDPVLVEDTVTETDPVLVDDTVTETDPVVGDDTVTETDPVVGDDTETADGGTELGGPATPAPAEPAATDKSPKPADEEGDEAKDAVATQPQDEPQKKGSRGAKKSALAPKSAAATVNRDGPKAAHRPSAAPAQRDRANTGTTGE